MTTAYVNRIGTAVPDHDVHEAFIRTVEGFLPDRRAQMLFKRMVSRSAIEHRYSFFEPGDEDAGGDREGFYRPGSFPGTAARMQRYERYAPELAMRALDALDIDAIRGSITHLVVASCTGFVAPGIDQIIVRRAELDPSVERTLIGFMGCYAAVNALRTAHHIIRSEPAAKVLAINLELCSMHFQETPEIEKLLSALLFGDGCAAALVTAEPDGVALIDFKSMTLPCSDELITWRIGDQGFDMHLSGQVPATIAQALGTELARNDGNGLLRGKRPADYDLWAVHAGGRTILDAVEQGFELDDQALRWSRGVLRDYGNMSSATLMFVLDRIMRSTAPRNGERLNGLAMAFGPGLAAETFRFELAA